MSASDVCGLPLELPRRQTVSRLHKAECRECGCVVRITAKWLDSIGPPLCPCSGKPMRDCRPIPEPDEAEKAVAQREKHTPIKDVWVRIRKSQYCGDCQRFHEPKSWMHFSLAHIEGRLRSDYFCTDRYCNPDSNIQRDRPNHMPGYTRIAA